MSFNDLLSLASAYTAIPLALIGFSVTIWQTVRARSAAEAARDAAKVAQTALARNSLLVLIPQLQRVEEELERSVQIDSGDLAVTWLSNWRWQAGQVRGLLGKPTSENKRLLKALQSSISISAKVKSDIIDGTMDELTIATKVAREAIADVTSELGTLAATQGMQMGDRNGG